MPFAISIYPKWFICTLKGTNQKPFTAPETKQNNWLYTHICTRQKQLWMRTMGNWTCKARARPRFTIGLSVKSSPHFVFLDVFFPWSLALGNSGVGSHLLTTFRVTGTSAPESLFLGITKLTPPFIVEAPGFAEEGTMSSWDRELAFAASALLAEWAAIRTAAVLWAVAMASARNTEEFGILGSPAACTPIFPSVTSPLAAAFAMARKIVTLPLGRCLLNLMHSRTVNHTCQRPRSSSLWSPSKDKGDQD